MRSDGIDFKIKDSSDDTVLHIAARQKDISSVQQIYVANSRKIQQLLTERNRLHHTPLDTAMLVPNNEKVVGFLAKNTNDPELFKRAISNVNSRLSKKLCGNVEALIAEYDKNLPKLNPLKKSLCD